MLLWDNNAFTSNGYTLGNGMRQKSFSELEYVAKRKQTRRDRFLAEIEAITPWSELVQVLEPFYPSGARGRPPIGLERMLRMYVAQQCFGLSDEGAEDALYDSQAIRAFVGIDLSREAAPDATTLLKFRRLLEKHQLTKAIFKVVNDHLEDKGLLLRQGTIVDASIIAAPPSTKNRDKARDPEMHQTRKGKQWYFGMKAHIGVDAVSGMVHSLVGTAANVGDVTQTEHLLHGEEKLVFADAGYTGVDKRPELKNTAVKWVVAAKRGQLKAMPEGPERDRLKALEKAKAQIRSLVEHPFHVIKNRFGHRKVRYRGLAKNTAQLFSLFALANLVQTKDRILAQGVIAP